MTPQLQPLRSRLHNMLRNVSSCTLLLAVFVHCSSPEAQVQYAPYQGPPAFPDRRAPLELPVGALAFVSNSGDDTVSVIDLASDSVIATRSVGRNPIDLDGPHHLAVDRARGVLFTALSYPALPNTVSGPHAEHGYAQRPGVLQVLSLSNLAPLATLTLDTSPGDVIRSPDGKRIVVSHFDLRRAVDMTLTAAARQSTLLYANLLPAAPYVSEVTRMPLCAAAHGITFAAGDAATVYVACYGDDSIARYTLGDPQSAIARVAVGPNAAPGAVVYGPYALAVNATGTQLVAAQTVSADLRFFALPGLVASSAPLRLRGPAYFPVFSADGRKLFVPSQGPAALARVDAESRSIVAERVFATGECEAPHEAVLSADESKLYVVCEGDHVRKSHVLVVDPVTLETRGKIAVGVYPDRFLIAAGTSQ
jgi:YVTN family beta-propeller protein